MILAGREVIPWPQSANIADITPPCDKQKRHIWLKLKQISLPFSIFHIPRQPSQPRQCGPDSATNQELTIAIYLTRREFLSWRKIQTTTLAYNDWKLQLNVMHGSARYQPELTWIADKIFKQVKTNVYENAKVLWEFYQ